MNVSTLTPSSTDTSVSAIGSNYHLKFILSGFREILKAQRFLHMNFLICVDLDLQSLGLFRNKAFLALLSCTSIPQMGQTSTHRGSTPVVIFYS